VWNETPVAVKVLLSRGKPNSYRLLLFAGRATACAATQIRARTVVEIIERACCAEAAEEGNLELPAEIMQALQEVR
jgi:hypothetical protein